MIDFNTEPYNDDYSEDKNFHRILFRPSFAVQARELTQLQTILQKQIQRHGDHIFKNGAMVVPGQVSVDTEADYVKLQAIYSGVAVETFLTSLLGKKLVGSSGVIAEVIKTQSQEESDPTTIYVKYITSGTNNTTKTFVAEEVLTTEDGEYSVQVQPSGSTPIGVGSLVSIERGVYYVNGHFVLVSAQTIVLDKYSNTPTYRIGLLIDEGVVTPEQDETLLDNAQNSFNFAAPGAHRYFIDLTLSKLSVTDTDDQDFVELMQINNGRVLKHVTTTDYAELEKVLARRTYDESGDYVVKDFNIDVREHRTNDRGAWAGTTAYLIGDVVTNSGNTYVAKTSGTSVSVAPTHTSGTAYDGPGSTGIQWEYTTNAIYNRGIFLDGDEDKLAIGMEPGKAYVRGYELEKIGTEYVVIDKARVYDQADNSFVFANVGNFVYVTNLNNLPPVNTFEEVSLYDRLTGSSGRGTAVGNKIGTARVRFVEWDSGTLGATTAVYKLSLFDVKLDQGKTFDRNVKSLYYSGGSAALSFSADVSPQELSQNQLIGSVTISTTTVTGNGTSFLTDFVVGDYIYVNGNSYRITAIATQNSLTIDTSVTLTTGTAYNVVKTKLYETDKDSLIFALPYFAVRSLRSSLGTNDTSYVVYERFTGTTSSASGGNCTLTISTSSGTMASGADNDDYILVDNTTGSVVIPSAYTPAGASMTFTLSDTFASRSFTVVGAVNKTGTTNTEKTKTLNTATVTFTTQATATPRTLLLGKADCWKITSILMSSGFGSSTYNIDISDRYDFDNGQRPTHYDVGRLILKDTYAPPSGRVQVVFEYFTHSTGDYCSVNSYPANVAYKDIPVELRDSLDYRPRIDDTGRFFDGTGSAVLIPKRAGDIRTDFSYYLSRKERIGLDINGRFFNIPGTPSLNPGEPDYPSTGLVLYNLTLEPYTFGTSFNNVIVNKVDNRRYTMRDIGRLEKRIDNLEYYTSLSLLEQDTNSQRIADSNGFERPKNGFIVDNFTGAGVGNTASPDYKCSIDMENGELRPFYTMKNVNLIEKNSNDSQRTAAFYGQYGDVITLPILEHKKFIEQPYATRIENINPFAVFTFVGRVSLNPPADEWFEVERRPDLIVNVEGNFNSIQTVAEKAGVLGTIWNAWQTQWTGATISTGRRAATAAELRPVGGVSGVTETFATAIGQARTGVRTSIVAKIDHQVVGDRLLSTAVIPFIRSRNILVQVRGLKPETRFYPYFDDIDISEYCTPASRMVYTGTEQFNSTSAVGGLATETARRINGDSQVCLNRGDVITGVTSGATAVVVGTEQDSETATKALYIVNIKGTFQANEQITGSISNASGTVVSVTTRVLGDPVITSRNGSVNLIYNIPNTDAVRFRTGNREFKLQDSNTYNGSFTSRGRAAYRAQGVLETRQTVINAVRNAEIVDEAVRDTRTVVETSNRLISFELPPPPGGDGGGDGGDPLAQTFVIDNRGGAFLTKVDVFFATKDPNIPVILEVRDVINGYPGKRILPFGRVVLNPDQVNLSNNTVALEAGRFPEFLETLGSDTNYPTFDTPTTFEFPSPVYVEHGQEYCIVLLADTQGYNVWISEMGQTVPGSTRTISEQPSLGVLFKSQNNSTWSPDQNQDLKFTIYRAEFDTSAVGTVQFVNDVLPYNNLEFNPLQFTSGSNIIRVWHDNHGLIAGSSVVIDGASGTINGIPSAQINATHVVNNIDHDSYTITVSSNATSTGYGGGSTIRAVGQVQYDAVHPIAQAQIFPETSVSYSMKTTTGKSVDGSETAYVLDSSFSPILANETNYFYAPKMVASETNENLSLGGNKSATLSINLSSSNSALSPVIDSQRVSLICVSNKVNYPTNSNVNVSPVDFTTLFTGATGAYSFSGSTITSTNSTVRNLMATVAVGQYIRVTSATTAGNNGQFLVTDVTDNGTTGTITVSGITFTSESAASGTTISSITLFRDEISPVGSSSTSKYVTNAIKLALPSTFVRIRFAANVPFGSDISVYYKTSLGSTSTLDTTKYTLVSPTTQVVKVENGNETFYDVEYNLDNMNPFDAIQVKLVMNSTNSSAIPRIKDFRVIACA